MSKYYEPFAKSKRGSQFKAMESFRTHPHRGSDWSVPAGSPIKAIADGEITTVTTTGPLGNVVIQSTYDGFFILYAHLQELPKLEVGTKVIGGTTLIGKVGNTGTATTGAHLHCTFGSKPDLISCGENALYDLVKHIASANKKS